MSHRSKSFISNIRLWKDCGLSGHDIVVNTRKAGLNVLGPTDLLGILHTTIKSRVYAAFSISSVRRL